MTLGKAFARYFEQETGLPVTWGRALPANLPTYLRQLLELHECTVDGERAVAVLLRDESRIRGTRAFVAQIEKAMELAGEADSAYCLVADALPSYLRRRLVGVRVPFVVVGEQIYWPRLGYLMTNQRSQRRGAAPTERLSPATQAVFVAMLLGQIAMPASATAMAEPLGYTAMSMSRAIKELEGNGLVRTELHGRERVVELAAPPKDLWQKAQPWLRSPVRETVRVMATDIAEWSLPRAGESALAEYSLLGPPAEPVYALASRAWRRLGQGLELIPVQDDGTCQVELWRYPPEASAREGCVDPLSLDLSLRDRTDERVEQAVEEMLEALPW
ncbi:hypothetical protein [Thioalkalivibrio sp. AKL17]|uniref:hypothetical protein n=1 Tax=Thioalkalivibrio sp. AKL17 TaxID=1158160 RepID=UPI001FCB4261|nr:hypothetical protein [Thioalkalivibrio sp. AKL17]